MTTLLLFLINHSYCTDEASEYSPPALTGTVYDDGGGLGLDEKSGG